MSDAVSPSAHRGHVLEDASRALAHGAVALRLPASVGWRPLVRELAAAGGVRLVTISDGVDRVERALLDLAAPGGPECVEAVAGVLRSGRDDLGEVFPVLDRATGAGRLLVTGWGALGSGSSHDDIGFAQQPRRVQLMDWLIGRSASVADRFLRPPAGYVAKELTPPASPPLEVRSRPDLPSDEIWRLCAQDVDRYQLSLAWLLLSGSEPSVLPSGPQLRERVVELLPPELTVALDLVAAHARGLPVSILSALGVHRATLQGGVDLGFWLPGDPVEVSEAWTDRLRDRAPAERQALHLRLAEAFASVVRPEDPAADRFASYVLEAHRHYVAAGQEQQALRFARYSVAGIVEAARARSMRRPDPDFLGAANLYAQVLHLGGRGEVPLPSQLRAYVRHYLHYNRAHARAEDKAETERGYSLSVEEWPGNALFWSRLARLQVYQDHLQRALDTLAVADQRVPDHPEKKLVLVARTVRGLLERSEPRPIEALYVWGAFEPRLPFEDSVARLLHARLEAGVSTDRLLAPGLHPVVLYERHTLCVIAIPGAGWQAEVADLGLRHRAGTPAGAVAGLVTVLREEVRSLVRALTHTLDPRQRLRKQVLLGAVDVVASALDAEGPREVWVMGDLIREQDGSLVLRTGGSFDARFPVPEALLGGAAPAGAPYLARVKAGRSGVPVGPVTRLERAETDDDDVWDAWAKRAHGG